MPSETWQKCSSTQLCAQLCCLEAIGGKLSLKAYRLARDTSSGSKKPLDVNFAYLSFSFKSWLWNRANKTLNMFACVPLIQPVFRCLTYSLAISWLLAHVPINLLPRPHCEYRSTRLLIYAGRNSSVFLQIFPRLPTSHGSFRCLCSLLNWVKYFMMQFQRRNKLIVSNVRNLTANKLHSETPAKYRSFRCNIFHIASALEDEMSCDMPPYYVCITFAFIWHTLKKIKK